MTGPNGGGKSFNRQSDNGDLLHEQRKLLLDDIDITETGITERLSLE